ncbi:uncharacterized protein F5891DRAFT_961426, partial [Suillus fuscotomentosus]
MPSNYNLHSQRSAAISEPTIPGSLAESPLTDVETYNTPKPSPTERSFSSVGDSILRPVHSYSDVVQTRSDSLQLQTGKGSASDDSTIVSSEEGSDTIHSTPVNKKPECITTSDESDNDDTPWKQVKRKRGKPRRNSKLKDFPRPNQSRDETLDEAERQLTNDERQCILNRKNAETRAQSHTRSISLGEGPSKGKGVDPRNWGDAGVSESEMDFDAQYQALKEWAAAR